MRFLLKFQFLMNNYTSYKVIITIVLLLLFKIPLLSQDNLFSNNEVLNITLKGPVSKLLNNRAATDKEYFPFSIQCDSSDKNNPVKAQIRTRGNFRKKDENCIYPPLYIKLNKTIPSSSVLYKQRKLKLVMPCANEDLVIKEWLVYRLYNILTNKSIATRLVKIELQEQNKKKSTSSIWGILLEDEEHAAKRLKMQSIKNKIKIHQLAINDFITMAVFQFMIGNTDWSVQYGHNIKIIAKDTISPYYTIPYDFDLAGIVDAPYALPAEELNLPSVKKRLYRGYCYQNLSVFEQVIEIFNKEKNNFSNLYKQCSMLDDKYKNATLKYLDDFYKIINNEKKWQKEFLYPCDKNGKGNIIIKGLQ